MRKIIIAFRIFFIIAIFISIADVVVMQIGISAKESEIRDMSEQIKEQKLRNAEMEDLLDIKNIDDFYKNIAEDQLGYGYQSEKIYKDITGN